VVPCAPNSRQIVSEGATGSATRSWALQYPYQPEHVGQCHSFINEGVCTRHKGSLHMATPASSNVPWCEYHASYHDVVQLCLLQLELTPHVFCESCHRICGIR